MTEGTIGVTKASGTPADTIHETASPSVHGHACASRFIEIELQESLTTLRTQVTLLIQANVGLLAANVAMLGYALSARRAVLVALCAIFPAAILYVLRRTRALIVPVLFTAVSLEASVLPAGEGLVSNFLLQIGGPQCRTRFLALAELSDPEARMRAFRDMPLAFSGRGFLRLLSWAGLIGQLLLGVVLSQRPGWASI